MKNRAVVCGTFVLGVLGMGFVSGCSFAMQGSGNGFLGDFARQWLAAYLF
jgi:hypothetical protein